MYFRNITCFLSVGCAVERAVTINQGIKTDPARVKTAVVTDETYLIRLLKKTVMKPTFNVKGSDTQPHNLFQFLLQMQFSVNIHNQFSAPFKRLRWQLFCKSHVRS